MQSEGKKTKNKHIFLAMRGLPPNPGPPVGSEKSAAGFLLGENGALE